MTFEQPQEWQIMISDFKNKNYFIWILEAY